MSTRLTTLCLLALALGISACSDLSVVQEALRSETPHERYLTGLSEAGLLDTALGERWLSASGTIRDQAGLVPLPFREVSYLSPERPSALAYRFSVQRGATVTVEVSRAHADSSRLFVDLFALPRDTVRSLELVATSEQPRDSLQAVEHTPRRDTDYILRIQPELLEGGQVTTTIQASASLSFPVHGVDGNAIRSFFGAERDGGRRSHEGVDIFAPRGTPVLASSPGRVSRVQETRLGGKVVWVRDSERRLAHYYAHLDSQLVRPGQRVQPGDTLGLVGNTGNARTTPPHLHYGIYQRGAVDPFPFIYNVAQEIVAPSAPLERMGLVGRVVATRANMRRGPTTDSPIVRTLPQHTVMHISGSAAEWHRVQLPDGTTGYMAAHLLEEAISPLTRQTIDAESPLRYQPGGESPAVDVLSAGTNLDILGYFGEYTYVQMENEIGGWLRAE